MSFTWVPVSRYAEVVTGGTPSKSVPEYYGGDIAFVTPSELNRPEPSKIAKTYLSEAGAKTVRRVPEYSVMVCCIGSLGKVGFADSELCTNQQINSLVFDSEKVDPRYGYHFCNTITRKLHSMSASTTVAIVNKSRFSELEIPIPFKNGKPDLAEQKRIAAILDKADGIRRKRQQALQLADDFLRSCFLDMFGDPVTKPKGWDRKALGELGTLERGASKHRPRNEPSLLGGDYPLIQTGDVANSEGYIRTYKSTYSEKGLKQSKMWPKGTLCITIAANIGSTGILTFDSCFPDSVVGFCSDQEGRSEYVQGLFWFLKKILDEQAPQVAQKNINLKILRELQVPSPPNDLQMKFANAVRSTEALRQRMKSEEDTNLFSSLQQSAFKGEL
jgi:type I restriction enzyme S subunit